MTDFTDARVVSVPPLRHERGSDVGEIRRCHPRVTAGSPNYFRTREVRVQRVPDDVVILSRLHITRHVIDLAAPQIALLYLWCHTPRVYFSRGTDDLHVFGAADSRGDEVPLSPQTGDLLTPQARCCTSKDGEIKADLLSQKNNFHPVLFFNVQQGNSGVHQRHCWPGGMEAPLFINGGWTYQSQQRPPASRLAAFISQELISGSLMQEWVWIFACRPRYWATSVLNFPGLQPLGPSLTQPRGGVERPPAGRR